jgi:diacylglycerol kinase (ATP)
VIEGEFLFVGASNTEIAGGGMRIAPGASVCDGLLNLNLIGAMSRWEALRQLRRLCRGDHTLHASARYLTAQTLRIETIEPIEIAADGDLIGHTPALISVKPSAVRVLAPPKSVGE